jgi:hypothetical protein
VGQEAALRLQYRDTSGLMWTRASGAERPARVRELSNPKLLGKLASEQGDVMILAPQEGEGHGIVNVRINDFVWSVDACFTAVMVMRGEEVVDTCDLEDTAKLLRARVAKVDAEGRLGLREAVLVLGLEWLSAGATPPAGGVALETPKLAEALATKTSFTQDEWDAFGIRNLTHKDVIKCGDDAYFVPAASKLDMRGLDLRRANCQDAILTRALLDCCNLEGADLS